MKKILIALLLLIAPVSLFAQCPPCSGGTKCDSAKCQSSQPQLEITHYLLDDMAMRSDGKPTEPKISKPEILIAKPGAKLGDLTIKKVRNDKITFETFFRYIGSSDYEPKKRFTINRGETLELVMCDVTDATMKLFITYKKQALLLVIPQKNTNFAVAF